MINATSSTAAEHPFAQSVIVSDIMIFVRDIDRSVVFYTEKLGFDLRERQPHFADFHNKGVTLALWQRDHVETLLGLEKTGQVAARSAGVAVLLSSAEEVDQRYHDLLSRGVTFIGEPRELPWNARAAYFTDPDGTIWELYAYHKP